MTEHELHVAGVSPEEIEAGAHQLLALTPPHDSGRSAEAGAARQALTMEALPDGTWTARSYALA